MIELRSDFDGKLLPINYVKFSDGAIAYRVEDLNINHTYTVHVNPSTQVSDIREEISAIMGCLDVYDVSLDIPYFPYARADRAFSDGMSNGVREFCNFINEYAFNSVTYCDGHSVEIRRSLIRGRINKQLDCFKLSLNKEHEHKKWDVVVSPDKGATDKAKLIADYLGVDIVYANKKRDVLTGKLTSLELPDYDFTGKRVLIPDDIGDNLGTHIWLSEMIRKQDPEFITLYVTHLIAPNGLEHAKQSIDEILCYQTVGGYMTKDEVNSTFNERK